MFSAWSIADIPVIFIAAKQEMENVLEGLRAREIPTFQLSDGLDSLNLLSSPELAKELKGRKSNFEKSLHPTHCKNSLQLPVKKIHNIHNFSELSFFKIDILKFCHIRLTVLQQQVGTLFDIKTIVVFENFYLERDIFP